MADRSIMIRIGANVSGLTAGLRTAGTQLKQFGSAVAANSRKHSQSWDTIGRDMTRFGLVTTAVVGSTVKAAMDWESAWTGVTKTVSGTPAQLSKVEDGLRGLAKTLPASHEEIAGVAEAAGQLGISTNNVVDFTKTMIDLGETTNLSAEEAATSLARFSNIMGTSQSNIDNVGSAIVGLGNNFATTESEIMQMGLRIAGAGKQAGMSEGDVLGLATALSSVGIEAEAGGSAISQTMTKIGMAVDTQSDKLDAFAQVAGMSAGEFSAAWKKDAGGALQKFIGGLDDTQRLGKSTNEVLKDLGITGIREADSLRRLSSAHELLGDAMATGNSEYKKNNALQIEAQKRYETNASKIQISMNKVKDASIDIGGALMPVVAAAAEAVGDLATAFTKLPGPVKGAVGVLGAFVGVGSLILGGAAKATRAVVDLSDAFGKLKGSSGKLSKVAGAISGLGRALPAAGIAAAIIGIGLAIGNAWSKAGTSIGTVDDYSAALERLGETGGDTKRRMAELNQLAAGKSSWTDFARKSYQQADSIKSVGDALSHVDKAGKESWWYKLRSGGTPGSSGQVALGFDTPAWKQSAETIENLDQAMADAVSSGNADAMAGAQQALTTAAKDAGISLADAKEEFPEYSQALGVAAAAADTSPIENLGAAQENLSTVMSDTTATTDDQTTAINGLKDAQDALAQGSIALSGSQVAYQKAVDDVSASIKKNGETLDITTEKGRANKTALLNLATTATQTATGMKDMGSSGQEVAGFLNTARDEFIKTAQQMGATKGQAKALADQFGLIPDNVDIEVGANTAPAREAGESATQYISRLKSMIEIAGNDMPARKKGESATAYIKRLKAAITIDGNDKPVRAKGEKDKAYISRLKAIMTIDGKDAPARRKGEKTQHYINRLEAAIGIDADTKDAKKKGKDAQKDIDGKKANVKVGADTSDVKKKTGQAKKDIAGVKGKTANLKLNTGGLNKGVSWAKGALKNIPDKTVKLKVDTGSSKSDVKGVDDAVSDMKGKEVDAKVDTSGQASKVSSLQSSIDSLHGRTVNVNVATTRTNTTVNRTVNKKAGGGAISGGTPGRDSVPALLMPGEHVLTREDVRALGGQAGAYAFRASLHANAIRYAKGGAVAAAEDAVRSAKRRRKAAASALTKAKHSKVTGKGKARDKSEARKEKRVNAAEKLLDKRDAALDRQQERLSALRATSRDTRIGIRRGDQRESATSGLSGAYSLVDEMFSTARSGNMNGYYGNMLNKKAYAAEKSMRKLYKTSDGIAKKLEKATSQMEELQQISDSVADTLTGGFNLGDTKSAWTGGAATSGKEYLASAQAYASKTKAFASKLLKLRKAGYSGVILQEVAGMGVEEGTVAADALLQLNPKDTKAMNTAYKDIETYAGKAGQYVSAGFYKGGLAAAEGLVSGLKKDQKKINKQINNMATSMIKALRKALGIHSPSTVFRDLGLQTGDGMVLGLNQSVGKVAAASEQLVSVPAAVSPSVYTTGIPTSSGATTITLDDGALARAMDGTTLTLQVDGKPVAAVVHAELTAAAAGAGATMRGGRR